MGLTESLSCLLRSISWLTWCVVCSISWVFNMHRPRKIIKPFKKNLAQMPAAARQAHAWYHLRGASEGQRQSCKCVVRMKDLYWTGLHVQGRSDADAEKSAKTDQQPPKPKAKAKAKARCLVLIICCLWMAAVCVCAMQLPPGVLQIMCCFSNCLEGCRQERSGGGRAGWLCKKTKDWWWDWWWSLCWGIAGVWLDYCLKG